MSKSKEEKTKLTSKIPYPRKVIDFLTELGLRAVEENTLWRYEKLKNVTDEDIAALSLLVDIKPKMARLLLASKLVDEVLGTDFYEENLKLAVLLGAKRAETVVKPRRPALTIEKI